MARKKNNTGIPPAAVEGLHARRMARKKNNTGIPQHEIDSLARAFIPAILNYFNSDDGQREFEEWKAQRAQRQSNIKD